MRDDREWLLDILEAIEKIQSHVQEDRDRFERNELVQVWAIHHIQRIGEAARHISDELRERYPQIPWAEIIATRNIVVHEYFRVDIDEVWATIERDLPRLYRQIEQILQELDDRAAQGD